MASDFDIADTAQVVESAILGDASVPRPDLVAAGSAANSVSPPDTDDTDISQLVQPDITNRTTTPLDTGNYNTGDTFSYRITYSNAGLANETIASEAFSVTLNGVDATTTNNAVELSNLPTSSAYTNINIYRTNGGADFFLLKSVAMTDTVVDDDSSDITGTMLNPALVGTPGAGGGHAAGEVYQYKFTFVDNSGTETLGSNTAITRTVNGTVGEDVFNSIVLGDIPQDASYESVNIYRTQPGGSDFFLLDNVATGVTSYIDDDSTPLDVGTPLDTSTINGNYTYLVTFYKNGSPESRPSLQLGPENVVDGRVHLTDLPIPPVPGPGDTFPAYDEVRVYRNLANDSNAFYLVATLDPGETYTDSRSDAEISDLTDLNNRAIDLEGPRIDSNTLLVDVVRRDGLSYENMFELGRLDFDGRKGGRTMAEKSFEITATSTVQDLADFMTDALGIQSSNDDPQNPIPTSLNNILGETGDLESGVQVVNGRLRIVSNNGVDNGVTIGLSAFSVTSDVGVVTNPTLGFGTVQEAKGQSTVTDFVVYDSLGVPLNMRITAVLESRSGTATTYRWFAESPGNDPVSGVDTSVGTGLVSFDGEGNLISTTNSTVSIQRRNSPASSPLEIELDFSQVSGLAQESAELAASRQDGSGSGTLSSFIIGEDGVIRGVFSNGVTRDLGQVLLARFSNPAGLEQRGQNLYAEGVNSGLPVQGRPGEQGIGTVIAGAVELSNTDIGRNLIDLMLATTHYRGNTRVITAAQQLLDELLNLRR